MSNVPLPRVRPVTAADRDWVVRVLSAAWADTTIVAHDVVYDAATLPAPIAEDDSGRVGVLTYNNGPSGLEVATINAGAPAPRCRYSSPRSCG